MNNNIMKILFGAQKQSLKQNIAICNFLQEYLGVDDTTSYDKIIDRILVELNFLQREAETAELYISDRLFLEYLLGVNGSAAIMQGVQGTVQKTPVGEHGKVVFDFICVASDDSLYKTDLIKRLIDEKTKAYSDSVAEARSKEDDAYALIREILANCPPSVRTELPDDDALAAILFYKSYLAAKE